MNVITRAQAIHAKVLHEHAWPIGTRLANPFGNFGVPPHRWRVGQAVWDELRAEADSFAPVSAATTVEDTLLGFPIILDEDAKPDFMTLERLGRAVAS